MFLGSTSSAVVPVVELSDSGGENLHAMLQRTLQDFRESSTGFNRALGARRALKGSKSSSVLLKGLRVPECL